MQALMLAAGMGRRLGKYTNDQTKCMVEVAGKTLLEHCVNALVYAGISKLVMVIGYEADRLLAYIESKNFPIEFEFIRSVDYATTNNIYSLYLARTKLIEDDTILVESDLIYEVDTIKKLLDHPSPNLVAVAKYKQWMDGTVTVLDEEGHIKEFIEKRNFYFENAGDYYKTVNIYKFSKEFLAEQYLPFLYAYIQAYGNNQYYELVLKAIAHLSEASLMAYVLDDSVKWYEIDDGQDLDIANTLFATHEDVLHAYEYHFGGFWRFDGLKDFCYLVNPHFPPQKMRDHMKYFFDTLLEEYPSGMTIQKLIAGKMFEVDEEFILVGNGAAELINTLGQICRGKTAMTMPSFNEYVRCFPHCEFQQIRLKDTDFAFDIDAFLKASETCDTVVVVNPDNPSGSFLKEKDLLRLLEACKKNNTKCVVDESFIDFAQPEIRYTFLNNEILQQYPNLIVIKSISKSYGVPGIRLGVLATSDLELLKELRGLLPVWNINSFAEYFLQIYGIYASEYKKACDKIAEERTRFAADLSSIPYLKVYPSEANYIMCEIKEKFSSKELTTQLLTGANILIKDLSLKDGFDHGNFIRIAVKSKADNDILFEKLKGMA